ncbi:MAG: undecaprenyl-diphosphate phosphatase [Spirochaetaceae bacterium]|jgi:undecaprenyl-diphosphatase|nr:undecaprenyl-diphosphate phosphatase [Spirochaetaceae bacterium]
MSIAQAIVLGVLQGITEFLPVSSSGHLAILQKVFGIEEDALLFDVALHGGTLLAILVALRADVWKLLRRPVQKLTGLLLLSTLVTALFALFFKKAPLGPAGRPLLDGAFASTAFLGAAFLITSLALLASELLQKRPHPVRTEADAAPLDALIVGICQGFGVLPGISRSGSALAGALGRKLDRNFAARYSFLLAIPAILGALILELKDASHAGAASGIGLIPTLAGAASAAIVGFFAMNLMLNLVRTKRLYGFSIYTALLGLLILFDTFVSNIFF